MCRPKRGVASCSTSLGRTRSFRDVPNLITLIYDLKPRTSDPGRVPPKIIGSCGQDFIVLVARVDHAVGVIFNDKLLYASGVMRRCRRAHATISVEPKRHSI